MRGSVYAILRDPRHLLQMRQSSCKLLHSLTQALPFSGVGFRFEPQEWESGK